MMLVSIALLNQFSGASFLSYAFAEAERLLRRG